MSRVNKIYERLMGGDRDANISYDDLCFLLDRLGFASRQQGTSHKVFKKGEGFVSLQEGSAGKAKPYQVRQAREALKKMNLRP
jgi:hypothetical protein